MSYMEVRGGERRPMTSVLWGLTCGPTGMRPQMCLCSIHASPMSVPPPFAQQENLDLLLPADKIRESPLNFGVFMVSRAAARGAQCARWRGCCARLWTKRHVLVLVHAHNPPPRRVRLSRSGAAPPGCTPCSRRCTTGARAPGASSTTGQRSRCAALGAPAGSLVRA